MASEIIEELSKAIKKKGTDFEVVAVMKIDLNGLYREPNIEVSEINHVLGPMAKESSGKILLGEKVQ